MTLEEWRRERERLRLQDQDSDEVEEGYRQHMDRVAWVPAATQIGWDAMRRQGAPQSGLIGEESTSAPTLAVDMGTRTTDWIFGSSDEF